MGFTEGTALGERNAAEGRVVGEAAGPQSSTGAADGHTALGDRDGRTEGFTLGLFEEVHIVAQTILE